MVLLKRFVLQYSKDGEQADSFVAKERLWLLERLCLSRDFRESLSEACQQPPANSGANTR